MICSRSFSAQKGFQGISGSGRFQMLYLHLLVVPICLCVIAGSAAPPNVPNSPQPANSGLRVEITPELSWKGNPATGDLYALAENNDLYRIDIINGNYTRLYRTGLFDATFNDLAWAGTGMFMGESFYGELLGIEIATGLPIADGRNKSMVWCNMAADPTEDYQLYSVGGAKSTYMPQDLYAVSQDGSVTAVATQLPIPYVYGLTCDGSGLIWAITADTLYTISKTVVVTEIGKTLPGIKDLAFDSCGRLWAQSASGLCIINTKTGSASIISNTGGPGADGLAFDSPPGIPGDKAAVYYDVYLDTVNPPVRMIFQNLVTGFCHPPALEYGTTYFWKVVARNGYGSKSSRVWKFTTRPFGKASIQDSVAPIDDLDIPFGTRTVGSVTTRNFTIKNTGSGNLTIKSVQIGPPDLYVDDFEDDEAQGWEESEDSYWHTNLGRYHLEIDGGGRSTYGRNHWSDLDYQVACSSGSWKAAPQLGLVIRASDDFASGRGSAYLFEINTGFREYMVAKVIDGQFTYLKARSPIGGSTGPRTTPYILRVSAQGSSLSFYIDGVLKWSGTDSSLKTGRIGLCGSNYERIGDGRAHFDDLQVTDLHSDCPFRFGALPLLPKTLAPGASMTVKTIYAPASAGTVTREVRIETNAPDKDFVLLSLSGTATGSSSLAVSNARR